LKTVSGVTHSGFESLSPPPNPTKHASRPHFFGARSPDLEAVRGPALLQSIIPHAPPRPVPVGAQVFSAHGTLASGIQLRIPGRAIGNGGSRGSRRSPIKRHLIVEAGTGTGKNARLFGAGARFGKRIVVSTGTKNRRSRLFFQGRPFLQTALRAAAQSLHMKAATITPAGRKSTMAKSRRYRGPRGGGRISNHPRMERLPSSATARRSRPFPESSTRAPKWMPAPNFCSGQKCPNFVRCFLTLMHSARRQESDIIQLSTLITVFADSGAARRKPRKGGDVLLTNITAVSSDGSPRD